MAHLMKHLVFSRFLIVRVLLLVFISMSSVLAHSHYETHVTYRAATRYAWNVYSRQHCTGWWFGHHCYTVYYGEYYQEYTYESVTASRCQRGWSPYPYCNEFDECTERTSGCNQICTNTVSNYTCSCYTGYKLALDGRTCNDIDECTAGGSDCAQNCSNTVGSYTCNCTAGYRLASNRRSCNDIDECDEGISGCAQDCYNTIGSYTCTPKCNMSCHLTSNGLSYNVTEQPDEPTEFEAQTLSKWVSESTDRWSVVVTLCVVVGVVLIIIGIVCFFVCAKKRKMNEAPTGGSTTNNGELGSENDYDDLAMRTTSMCSESHDEVTEYANVTMTTTPASSESRKQDLRDGEAADDSIYQDLVASKEMSNVYEEIRKFPK